MNAEKIQNYAGNQKKLIDVCIIPGIQITKGQLLHRIRSFSRRSRTKTHFTFAVCINFQNHVVIGFVVPANAVPRKLHQNFVKMQNIALTEVDVFVAKMNLVQRITVAGNLRFVMVQGRTVLVDDGSNTLIAGYNTFDGIGAFDRLNFCYSLQFGKHLHIFGLAHTSHCFQLSNVRCQVQQIGRKKSIVQK